jgi:hypothetical protein
MGGFISRRHADNIAGGPLQIFPEQMHAGDMLKEWAMGRRFLLPGPAAFMPPDPDGGLTADETNGKCAGCDDQ